MCVTRMGGHRHFQKLIEIFIFPANALRNDIIMETYFELGMTYKSLGLIEWAKVAFKKFIEIAKFQNIPKSICDGYLELALSYRG